MNFKWDKVLITTPLFYPSGNPHLGHAFTTVVADVIKKYYSLIGVDAFLLMGNDEHGEKILLKSQASHLAPEQFVKNYLDNFLSLWSKLKIDFDNYVRTSNEEHKQFVQDTFSSFLKKGIVEKKNWCGFYCVSCEENISSDVAASKGNKCSLNHPLVQKNEESYFLKCSLFSKWLRENLFKQDFISPGFYKKELENNFLSDLKDLSITRKELDWGVKLKEDSDFTVYVWFDALLGYLSGDKNNLWKDNKCKKIHVIGKEIVRFHSIYLPILLKNLDISLFDKLICHSWLLFNNEKMSKSLGNVVDPNEIMERFSVDVFRFYLINLNWGLDVVFSEEEIALSNNVYLANLFGNIVSRFYGLLKKNNLLVPKTNQLFENNEIDQLNKKIDFFINQTEELIFGENIQKILENVFALIKSANKLIDTLSPWNLKPTDAIYQGLLVILYKLISFCNFMLSPVLVDKSKYIFYLFNQQPEQLNLKFFLNLENFSNVSVLPLTEALFERI